MAPDPARALTAFGIDADVVALREDQRNMTWEIRRASGTRSILRRHRADRGLAEVAYELDVIDGLDRLGWPVPVAESEPRAIDGAIWSVTRFLEGSSLERTPENQFMLGRLMAELHDDLPKLEISEQRAGWTRSDDVFAGSPAPVETFRAIESERPDEMRELITFAEMARARLTELRSHEQPSVLVHGDLTPWNVLAIDGAITGILDFEMAHLDLLVAEFAHTWRGRYAGFIKGFEQVRPLTPLERALIAPVRWATLVGGAQHALARDSRADLQWYMTQLQRRSPLENVAP